MTQQQPQEWAGPEQQRAPYPRRLLRMQQTALEAAAAARAEMARVWTALGPDSGGTTDAPAPSPTAAATAAPSPTAQVERARDQLRHEWEALEREREALRRERDAFVASTSGADAALPPSAVATPSPLPPGNPPPTDAMVPSPPTATAAPSPTAADLPGPLSAEGDLVAGLLQPVGDAARNLDDYLHEEYELDARRMIGNAEAKGKGEKGKKKGEEKGEEKGEGKDGKGKEVIVARKGNGKVAGIFRPFNPLWPPTFCPDGVFCRRWGCRYAVHPGHPAWPDPRSRRQE